MKKILIILSLLLVGNIECSIFDRVGDVFKKPKEIAERLKACAEVPGLGTKWAAAKGALETAKKAVDITQKGTQGVAFNSAKGTLTAAKKSGEGILTLADAIAKGLQKGFNIQCIRFLGKLDTMEFELIANIFEHKITVRKKVNFTSPQEFAQEIFNILKDKASDIKKV